MSYNDDYIFEFQFMSNIKGTQAEEYLKGRRINVLPRKGVRYEQATKEPQTQQVMGSMTSAMTNDRMKIAYFHRTYLKDGLKAQDINAKKIFTAEGQEQTTCDKCGSSISRGATIKMFDCDSTMGIAEGIETALSATQIYECPTWSTANSGYMKDFTAPPSVKHLMIFADNDLNGNGLAAAFTCGNRNINRRDGVDKVTIRTPTDVVDFNDMLFTQSDTFDWVLTRKR